MIAISKKEIKILVIKNKKPTTVSRKIVFSVIFVLFLLYAATLIYAGVYMLFVAVKTQPEYVLNKFSLPKRWLFSNFIKSFEALEVNGTNSLGMLINSLWYTVGGTLITVTCSSTLAYVVSKYKFFGRGTIYFISVIIMILPIVGSLPASYRLITSLGINNSPLILITFANGFGFNFIVLYGFFQSLSWSYAEAAFLDGASDFYTFIKVMIPQALPAITSLIILSAIGTWNDYQTPLLYLGKMPTLSVGLYEFNLLMELGGDYPTLFCGMIISTIPILLVFIIFQETIMSNTVAGGLKG